MVSDTIRKYKYAHNRYNSRIGRLLLIDSLFIIIQLMLKYFLEEEEPQADQQIRTIMKTQIIKKRQYRPFHLECSFTKKKICYCQSHPIAKIPHSNRNRLWDSFKHIHNFYSKVSQQKIEKSQVIFQRCRDKIKRLSRAEVAEFVRNLRSDKSLHMGQNGEFQNM